MIEATLKMAIAGAFIGVLTLTKSFGAAVAAAVAVLASFIGIRLYRNKQRAERLKLSGISEIDEMDGRQFEHYLGHLLKSHGYSVEVTRAAGDYGADLVIKKDGKKIVVQAKRHSKNVGLKAVQEVQASIAHYGALEGWVISNREYTNEAYALAKSNGIRLINREQLIEMSLKMNSTEQGAAPVIQAIKAEHPQEDRRCGRCGSRMVLRTGPKGEFYGCSSFPKCRYVTPISYQ
ncbi:restriction endonuclease [Paenibacillus xanthanilyticus]